LIECYTVSLLTENTQGYKLDLVIKHQEIR